MSTARVLIADAMSPRALEILQRFPQLEVDVKTGLKPPELAEIIAQYDAIMVRSSTKLTADQLARATRLRVVGRAGIGVDNVDVPAASAKGVVVMNTPFGNATTTAEHAIAMLMALTRHIPQATASMRGGKWEKTKFEGREVSGKTLGVIGLGNIGKIVADRARGLKMQIVGYDPFLTAEAALKQGIEKVSLAELFQRADYVTVHTPLTAETRNLIGEAAFVAMKPGVFVINCARGGIVDEAALLVALESGKVAGAALDVFVQEPVPADHPLLQHPRVILTPHLGASTAEAQETVALQLAEQIAAFLIDGTVTNAVNTPSVSGESLRALAPYLELGAKIGSLAGQIHDGEVSRIEVHYYGDLATAEVAPVTARTICELLNRKVDPPVNAVSAIPVARERGIAVETSTCAEHADFTNLIALRVFGGDRETEIQGTITGKRDLRIVGIDGYRLDLVPQGSVLLIRNEDKPGIIGAVGTELGKRSINVSRLAVGLRDEGGEALAVWSTDAPVPDEVIEAIRKPVGMRTVHRLEL